MLGSPQVAHARNMIVSVKSVGGLMPMPSNAVAASGQDSRSGQYPVQCLLASVMYQPYRPRWEVISGRKEGASGGRASSWCELKNAVQVDDERDRLG
jgi:hypothetical protein